MNCLILFFHAYVVMICIPYIFRLNLLFKMTNVQFKKLYNKVKDLMFEL
jgi:hypothetical protein